MIGRFMVLFMGLAASTVFASAKREAGASAVDNSLVNVLNSKKLIVGLDDSFPPMGFRNAANEIGGYDGDLAKEVGRRLGIQVIFQPIDWNAKEQELNTGEILPVCPAYAHLFLTDSVYNIGACRSVARQRRRDR